MTLIPEEYKNVCDKLASLINQNKKIIVAIDGCSGAGKSTLAEFLQKKFQGITSVFHTDDFYLQAGQRTEKRLKEIGGNVDYERLKTEIINNLKQNKYFYFRKFDCGKMELSEPVKAQTLTLNILEGVYSTHSYFESCFDLKIFLKIPENIQKKRIINRNGEIIFKRFEKEWIPKENDYFQKFETEKNCDLIFDTSAIF